MALLFPLKIFLISTVVVFFTAMKLQEVRALVPFITNFIIKHVSLTWNFCLSCFKPRPPYLFLLFNSIIISISASTMFHHRSHPTPPAYVAKASNPNLHVEEEEEEEHSTLERTDNIPSEPSLEDVWKGIRKGKETTLQKHDRINERRVMRSTRIEPSPSLEELNRRAEAFIRKFKEEIRLQKLHSLSKSEHEDDDEKRERIFFYN